MLYPSIDIRDYAYYSQAWTIFVDALCSPTACAAMTFRAAG